MLPFININKTSGNGNDNIELSIEPNIQAQNVVSQISVKTDIQSKTKNITIKQMSFPFKSNFNLLNASLSTYGSDDYRHIVKEENQEVNGNILSYFSYPVKTTNENCLQGTLSYVLQINSSYIDFLKTKFNFSTLTLDLCVKYSQDDKEDLILKLSSSDRIDGDDYELYYRTTTPGSVSTKVETDKPTIFQIRCTNGTNFIILEEYKLLLV